MSGLSDEQIEKAARTVLDRVRAMGDITDGEQSLILRRALNLFMEEARGKTMCLRCCMLIPLHTDGEAEHIAACRLPCLPGWTRRDDWRVHRDIEQCPICHSEMIERTRVVIVG